MTRVAKRRIIVLLHVQHAMEQETLPSNALWNLLRKQNNAETKQGNIWRHSRSPRHCWRFDHCARDDKEHDNILNRVLSRARDKGVKFNSEKIQFKIGQVENKSHGQPRVIIRFEARSKEDRGNHEHAETNDYSCPGGPRHKPFGFQEDLHGHNYVCIVLS